MCCCGAKCSFVPQLCLRSWENRVPLTPHPLSLPPFGSEEDKWGKEQAYAGRREDRDVVAKQSIDQCQGCCAFLLSQHLELHCQSNLQARRGGIKTEPLMDLLIASFASSCPLCCSFYNAVGSAPLIAILLQVCRRSYFRESLGKR